MCDKCHKKTCHCKKRHHNPRHKCQDKTKVCSGRTCASCPNPQNCTVNLSYQEIFDDFWPDASGAIQHQYEWQEIVGFAAVRVLEIQKEFSIPVARILSGTEPNPDAGIYGYNLNGSLDLNGGKAKSYDPLFKEFHLRYHAALETKFADPSGPVTQELSFLTPTNVKQYYDRAISYYAARGFDIQGPDTFSKFSDQYIWTYAAGQNQAFNTSSGYVAIRLIWNNDKCRSKVPDYVDLHATANTNPADAFVLDTYQPNPLLRENGHGYPTRIPVTTDFCGVFQQQYNVSPIAFYDVACQVLTIHVPETEDGHFLTRRVIDVGNPIIDADVLEHLLAFDGSFALFRRCKTDTDEENITRVSAARLVASNFKCVDVFAQVSESVHIKSKVIDFGELVVPDPELFNPIRTAIFSPDDESLYYTGVVCAKMNGGTKSFDAYCVPFPSGNSYATNLDPLQLPEENEGPFPHAEGDNPITTVKEQFSSLSSHTLYDWDEFALGELPISVLTGETSYPENVNTTVAPVVLPPAETFSAVVIHEFAHQTHFASGMLYFVPTEGMADGLSMDTRANRNILWSFTRAQRWTQIHIRLTRAGYTMMSTEAQVGVTYGLSLFYKYLQDQFDFNNQVQRRTVDVLTSETAGPLFKANNIPDTISVFPVNSDGGSAALKQSLLELFGKDIKDVWNDFSISLVLLRNNEAIPAQYRHYFPYWLWNTEYLGYPVLLQRLINRGLAQFADWWEQFDTNGVIPASYGTAFTGETFVRTLPSPFNANVRDLRTLSFNVPHSTNTVTVTITAGEWRITLLQFTSDGTQIGSFIQDGPHTIVGAGVHVFNIVGHVPAFTPSGNIRLVCANVSFSGTGLVLSDYFQSAPLTGTINIVAV